MITGLFQKFFDNPCYTETLYFDALQLAIKNISKLLGFSKNFLSKLVMVSNADSEV